MRKFLVVAAAAAVTLAGCAPAQAASSEIKARWGETVEVDGIAVTLAGHPDNDCYDLTIGNERWLRDISADEGGAVVGYAGPRRAMSTSTSRSRGRMMVGSTGALSPR